MPWPQPTDYNAAIQNPAVCFADADLRQGQVAGDLFGLPRPHSGNFADVYQVQGPSSAESGGRPAWAVKCFTREVHGLQARYQAISEHLERYHRPFMVDFRYLEQGILIGGQWYPILKMRWVEGFRLNEFVAEHLGGTVGRPCHNGSVLDRLAQMWVKLAQELREAGMAHGDLQHGNVLLVPGSKTGSLLLRLIDYDGMVVPALAEQPSGEIGHPHYQHPQRLREGTYNAEVDRFAHLVIYSALRVLSLDGKALWDRYDNGENLLFREEDFRNPADSRLLHELWAHSDEDVRNLVGWLLLASQAPIESTPLLDELLIGSSVKPLLPAEQDLVRAVMGDGQETVPQRGGQETVPQLGTNGPPLWHGLLTVPHHQPPISTPDWLVSHLAPAVSLELPVPLTESEPLPVPSILALATVPDRASSEGLTTESTEVTEKRQIKIDFSVASVSSVVGSSELPILEALPVDEEVQPPPAQPPPLPYSGPVPPRRRLTLGQLILRTSDWVLERPWVLPWVFGPVVLLILVVVGFSFPRAPKPPPLPPEPPPPQPAPVLFLPSELALDAGETAPLHLQVRRNGNAQPLEVRLNGLPENVTAEPITLAPEHESAVARISAGIRADNPGEHVRVSLWEEDHKLDEKRFVLTIHKKFLPDLAPVDPLILQPGEETQLLFQMDRQGNRDVITVQLEDLPPAVSCQPRRLSPIGLPIRLPGLPVDRRTREAEIETVSLVVRAEKDAGPITARPVQLTLWIGSVKVANQPLTISVEKPLPRLFVLGQPTLLIGNKEQLKVHAERRNFVGPIEVRLEDLPEGVKCERGVIPADDDSVLLDLTVSEETASGQPVVRLTGKVGKEDLPAEEITLHFARRDEVVRVPRKFPGPRQVEFPTVDGVSLRGQFYPGVAGKGSIGVLLLHDLGQNNGEDVCSELARVLQSKGFAVLSFDFRGHGGSKKVSPEFWTYDHNALLGASDKKPDQIHARDFPPAYWKTLVYDIAAARRFLDQSNDAGELNSSNLIVIGAGKGGTLGALWLASECYRFETGPAPQPEGAEPESAGIMAAIWLGMDPKIGASQQPVDAWLHEAGQVGKVPMLFVHGEGDPVAAARCRTFLSKAGAPRTTLTSRLAIPRTTSTGTYLLRDNLPTISAIVRYLGQVVEQRKERPWQARHFEQKGYRWEFPQGPGCPAKQGGAKHLTPLPLGRMGVR